MLSATAGAFWAFQSDKTDDTVLLSVVGILSAAVWLALAEEGMSTDPLASRESERLQRSRARPERHARCSVAKTWMTLTKRTASPCSRDAYLRGQRTAPRAKESQREK